MKNPSDLHIVIVGAGAIGGTVAAWLAPRHAHTALLARGDSLEAIRAYGITLYPGDQPDRKERVPVRAIASLSEVPEVDVLVLAVKLYNLEHAAQWLKEQAGNRSLILGIQNGLANQDILPRYFSRVLYGIAGYNAWVDAPGVIGYQAKGPLILGTPDNCLAEERDALAALLSQGVRAIPTDHFQDAAHCKLAINLANSVTTLVGHHQRKIHDLDLYQDLLANTLYEGVQVIHAAGYREARLGDIPPWRTLWAAARLPRFLTRPIFRRNLRKMTLSSMAQDVYGRGGTLTELEYLNGYLLALAEKHGVDVPYNRAIYRLCRERFARPDFQPVDVREVWEEVQIEIRRGRGINGDAESG